MNKQIIFSIILPLYNKETHIRHTIESVLKQSFKEYELLIIDDGSTDNSYTIAKSFNDPRISLIQQANGGPSRARNRGIHKAKGKYIAFIDADDAWHPQYLESQYYQLSLNPELMWSCVGYQKICNNKTTTVFCFQETGIINDVADEILKKPYIWTGAVAIKSDVFKNSGFYFNEKIKRSEDLELWFKLACLYPKLGYTNKILSDYYVSVDGSLTFTAHENEDFSYLTLRQRIEHELCQTSPERQNKIITIINAFCKRELLKTWKSTNLFKVHEDKFKHNLDHKLFLSLSYLHTMPTLIKKVYVRLLEIAKLAS